VRERLTASPTPRTVNAMRSLAARHGTAVTAVGVVALTLVLAFATSEGRAIVGAVVDGDSRRLRHELLDLHVIGVLVLLLVILSHAILPFPAEIVNGAAGYVYGFTLALPLVLLFWLLSGLLAYWLAERFGRPLARRMVGERRLARGEGWVARAGPVPLLSVRVLPFVPYNAICYAAGIVHVPLRRFAWTTLVGIVPLTTLATYLGSRLEKPDFSDWRIWAAIGAFTALAIAAQLVERRLRARHT
jgi:uncharacterized membrane protein YdjX (TVP38/TMEM64 family)